MDQFAQRRGNSMSLPEVSPRVGCLYRIEPGEKHNLSPDKVALVANDGTGYVPQSKEAIKQLVGDSNSAYVEFTKDGFALPE